MQTPREALEDGPLDLPEVHKLLLDAEELGGVEAVRRALLTVPSPITSTEGWDVIKSLPKVIRLTNCSNRVLISHWSAQREHTRSGGKPAAAADLLPAWGALPRAAAAEVLLQLRHAGWLGSKR